MGNKIGLGKQLEKIPNLLPKILVATPPRAMCTDGAFTIIFKASTSAVKTSNYNKVK